MKKLAVGIGFAAMLSLFTAIGANAEGFNKHNNSGQPNERGMADRGSMNRYDDHARFDRHEDRGRMEGRDDRGRMDRDHGGDRYDRGRGGDHFRDRHYDQNQYRGWR